LARQSTHAFISRRDAIVVPQSAGTEALSEVDLREVGIFVDAVLAMVEPVETHFMWCPQLRDPADELVALTVDRRLEDSNSIPNRAGTPPKSRDTCRSDPEDQNMKNQSAYPLRLPRSVKAEVERRGKQDGISVNQFVATAVAEKLADMSTAQYFAERRERADFTAFDRLMRRQVGEPSKPDDTIA
jgi:hypothetical protein